MGSEITEGFSGSVIEGLFQGFWEPPRVVFEALSFGEVLSDEPIGILDRSSLPGRAGIAVVELHAEWFFELPGALEFHAVIIGECAIAIGEGLESRECGAGDGFPVLVIDPAHERIAALSIDQR